MSSDALKFKDLLKSAKNILVITGAGISAESGIPTFRGATGLSWRNYRSDHLARLQTFKSKPSLVWEFYHYRREVCLKAHPNDAHIALSQFERNCNDNNKIFSLITQNVDGLHRRAGSLNIIPIHGEIFETRCIKCGDVRENVDSPISPALAQRGDPQASSDCPDIPTDELPRCGQCQGLLRPNVVFFGENLRTDALASAMKAVDSCDLCLVIGTSAVVEPVASFPLEVVARGMPVAEFNVARTSITDSVAFSFLGPSGETLPPMLAG